MGPFSLEGRGEWGKGGLARLQALTPGKKPQGLPRDCARQGLGVPLGSVWQPYLVFAHQLLLSESAPGFLLPQGQVKTPGMVWVDGPDGHKLRERTLRLAEGPSAVHVSFPAALNNTHGSFQLVSRKAK